MSSEWEARLAEARIMPIVSVGDLAETVALVDDLAGAGAAAVEILFRHPAAPDVLRLSRRRHPNLLLAAGTVINAELVGKAVDAGADVLVSPGLTPTLARTASGFSLPLIAGVQTASEVLLAAELGFKVLKFYPAEPNNAAAILKDYANVFPDILFVPTGGIGEAALPVYAGLRNVVAVGGSWLHAGLAPGDGRRSTMTANIARARALLGPSPVSDRGGR